MRTFLATILLIYIFLAFLPSARAFGAGELPDFAFLKESVSHRYRRSQLHARHSVLNVVDDEELTAL
jgi:hypothetical protein